MNNPPSIFWPLQILVTVMGLCIVCQLVELNSQRVATQRTFAQLVPQYQSALQIEQRRQALAQDLLQTSAQDAGAAQIVKEFHIQVNKPEEKK